MFSGGRGASKLLKSFDKFGLEISVAVNAYDDGHSTGDLRQLFNILGPSDCRKNCEHLLPENIPFFARELFNLRLGDNADLKSLCKEISWQQEKIRELLSNKNSLLNSELLLLHCEYIKNRLSKEIEGHQLNNCSFMNLVFTSCVLQNSSFQKGIDQFCSIFGVKHEILVNSEDDLYLLALTQSGHVLLNESSIVEGRNSVVIDELFLLKGNEVDEARSLLGKTTDYYERFNILRNFSTTPRPNPALFNAIRKADFIVYSAGTLNSSLLPTYLTQGIVDEIKNSRAHKILISNIGADYETTTFKSSDFVRQTVSFLRRSSETHVQIPINNLITHAYINSPKTLRSNHVIFDYENDWFSNIDVRSGNFEDKKNSGVHSEEFSEMLATALVNGSL